MTAVPGQAVPAVRFAAAASVPEAPGTLGAAGLG